jgi:hypothetical protein
MYRPLLTRYGEIGSEYPTNVYDGNRVSLPILRQTLMRIENNGLPCANIASCGSFC